MAGPDEHLAKAERLTRQAWEAERSGDYPERRRLLDQADVHTEVARDLKRRQR